MAKSGRLELGAIFTDIICLYSTTATYLASKEIEIGEKTLRAKIDRKSAISLQRGQFDQNFR